MRALSGPAGAQFLQLDGFREGDWKQLWCSARNSPPQVGIIRSRNWSDPTVIDGMPIATPSLVLRHLAHRELEHRDLSDHDLVELAVEHALRDGLVSLHDLATQGAHGRGERILREVLKRRPIGEPPTESYAETRALQVFRSLDIDPWRQLEILERGRIKHRVDFVIPHPERQPRRRRRPSILAPADGLLIEIDSKEWHTGTFERDHERQSVYDRLGFHWIALTPTQIEGHQVKRTIEGALRRMATAIS